MKQNVSKSSHILRIVMSALLVSSLVFTMLPHEVDAAVKKVKVTWNVNGGKFVAKKYAKQKSYAVKITKGKKISKLPKVKRTGYSFKGWYSKKSKGKKITKKTTIKKNSNFYAHWTAKKYNLSFNANGGKVTTKSKKVTFNKTYGKLPTPAREGYTFKGWYTASSGGKAVTEKTKYTSAKNTTIFAHWEKIPISMTSDVKKLIAKTDLNFADKVTEILAYDTKYFDDSTGFRTAGSKAEHKAANYLRDLWEEIGLTDIEKIGTETDKWQFNGAKLTLKNDNPKVNISIDPISYASDGTDAGGIDGELVYIEGGYKEGYDEYYEENGLQDVNRNMNGKIVLAGNIDQYKEYWIDSIYNEAFAQGADAVISYSKQYVSGGGKWEEAIQIQDLCAPNHGIPCVAISKKDGEKLKAAIEDMNAEHQTPECKLVVDNIVEPDGETYNIVGKIKGTGNTGQQIIMAGHYDKYFYGMNDDCAAIGLIAGAAKAMVDSGYEPVNDILFVAHGAEEWGKAGVETDWAQGAWEMITQARPEWQDNTIALLNFELPAKRGTTGGLSSRMSSVEESMTIMDTFVNNTGLLNLLPEKSTPKLSYGAAEGSDAVCYQFNGVPHYEIAATAGSKPYSLSTYHTQFDDKNDYSSQAMKHALMMSLAMASYIDQTPAIELDMGMRCEQLRDAIAEDESVYENQSVIDAYKTALSDLEAANDEYLEKAKDINKEYEDACAAGKSDAQLNTIRQKGTDLNKNSLEIFREYQDELVGLSGDGDAYVFHQISQDNMLILDEVIDILDSNQSGLEGDAYDAFYDTVGMLNGELEYNACDFSADTSKYALLSTFPSSDSALGLGGKGITDNRSWTKRMNPVLSYEATNAVIWDDASSEYADELLVYNNERQKMYDLVISYLTSETAAINDIINMMK